MICFKNGEDRQNCNICALKYSANGGIMNNNIPEIDIYKNSMTITFREKVIAKDFAKYFGYLQERILSVDSEQKIIIDFQRTLYINHFCISKLLLTLYKIRSQKEIIFLFPAQTGKNKMLRFLHNLGILDFIFENFQCRIENEIIQKYSEKYDFNDCYDYAILPYIIYDEEIKDDNVESIEKIVDVILQSIENYYATRRQTEKYRQIESRVHLYLFEIIDNIFQHAYPKENEESRRALFAINVYNSYLPPYKVLVGTPEEAKFENRIERLQREVPMSVYKNIHDRFFGGFNILVDDIGASIQSTYTISDLENVYKDVYLNGSKKRKTINGLKLVADQISCNNDLLWAHDGRNWISTSFIENSSIVISDESETIHYKHPAIKGLTYDLFINLAKNSKEKKKTYENFGSKVTFSLEDIKEIISNNKNGVFVDLLNVLNRNKSFEKQLNSKAKYLFYRPRATQKNKMANEFETRVIDKFSEVSQFDSLVIYDLNQTTLFQIKAVFENKGIALKLLQKGFQKIILITEESWLFAMQPVGDIFMLKKEVAQGVSKKELKNIYSLIHKNDSEVLQENLERNISEYLYEGNIYWGFKTINEYIDVEKMIMDRNIWDLIRKSISRMSGMLGEKRKLVFLDKFMEISFDSLVNEYKDGDVQIIYFGSIILSGETEKRVTGGNDIKIYLFRHRECEVELNGNHLILFSLPDIKNERNKGEYRRILNTNRIEICSGATEEYDNYLSEVYTENLKKIEYVLGFFPTGFFSFKKNKQLYDGYLQFVISIIKIEMAKFDTISVNIKDNTLITELKEDIEKEAKRLGNTEYRNLGKKIYFEKEIDDSIQLIIELGEEFELIDMMTEMKQSKNEVIYIPVFNNIHFDKSFEKIVNAGYMPYLPLFYSKNDFFITDVKLDKFYSFTRTLNPRYRRKLEIDVNGEDSIKMGTDFTNEVYSFYDHLLANDTMRMNLLVDVINRDIGKQRDYKIDEEPLKGQYYIFIEAILLQHSIVKMNSEDITKTVDNILGFLAHYCNIIDDSIITYLLLIIVKSISMDIKLLDKLFEKETGKELLHSKSSQVSILFADLYNDNCRFRFQTELNEFFVSNDITIYYNMLAQLLFNSHGAIHDSKLDTIYKKLVENMGEITDEDVKDIYNIIPNCIALLKLTKSYDNSIEKEENLEQQFFVYSNNIRENLQNIRTIIEEIMECAKERFEIIDKEQVQEGIKRYFNKIEDVLQRKKYNINGEEISNFNVIIHDSCETNGTANIKRNINLYNDTIIFEELAYLLHNAHSHSYKAFSLYGNDDKKYLVWVKAELHGNYICLRLFNSIEKRDNNYNSIITAIQEKRRVGKTYLEKFNIHVSYYANPKGIKAAIEEVDIFETRIEIPYFT